MEKDASPGPCFLVDGGNPVVKLTDDILQDPKYADDIHVINLPSTSKMGSVNALMQPAGSYFHGSAFYLKEEIEDVECDMIPMGSYQNIFGKLPDGRMLYFSVNMQAIEKLWKTLQVQIPMDFSDLLA